MTERPSPALSVVVVPLGDAVRLAETLDALRREAEGVRLEVIVPDDPDRGRTIGSLGAERLAGVVRPVAPPGADTWALRSIGVAAARAPIVATLEDQAVPEPGWAAAILAAHREPYAAVGGAVSKGTPDSLVGWAMYFFDYWRYIAPHAGMSQYLSACNVSYKRAALEAIAPLWTTRMHETDVHAALADRGERLWLDPQIAVRQRRPLSWAAAVRELVRHGRLYGEDRRASLPPASRFARAAATPALPFLHVARAGTRAWRAPELRMRFAVAAPAVTVLAFAWSLGELRGLLATTRHH
jgi:hypothetical protein